MPQNLMNWKISALILAALSAAVPACAQHSSSEPVLDVSAMDKTIDPCADFFTYSCGGWIKKNPIPPDQTGWSVYHRMADDNKKILRDILESAAVLDPNRDAVRQKIGDYYAACMDEKTVESAGGMPLKGGGLERIAKL